MYSNFEKLIQKKISNGLSLKQALSDAASENPGAHDFFIKRENSQNKKGLTLIDQYQFKTFSEAVKKISEMESITLAQATRAAAYRYPKLHADFLSSLKKKAGHIGK